ncbi:MAG: L-2-hydroxyglutarate oxidase [Microscillaceae bacterium]
MRKPDFDILIIGGGIVGLATAFVLKNQKPSLRVAVLEKEKDIARHQTGHNSGVIHSGIYYKPGSLKAQNCLRGYQQLVDFCQKEEIPFELCGKIIVATASEEIPALKNIFERGQANGLAGLRWLNQSQIAEYEPHVQGLAAVYVPQTGIVDYTEVSRRYVHRFQEKEGQLRLGERVLDIQVQGTQSRVITSQRAYTTRLVINCAGLYSDKMARLTYPSVSVKIVPFRGEYYELVPEKQHLVRNLVYPVPNPNFPFLGVHFTRMIGGGVEAGPNAVFAFRREGYRKTDVHLPELWEALTWPGFQKVARRYWQIGLGEMYRSFSKAAFVRALQKLIPAVQSADLHPAGAGVRAQACDREGGLLDDFAILAHEPAIHVLNAPSPAATSSLSIGETLAQMALQRNL